MYPKTLTKKEFINWLETKKTPINLLVTQINKNTIVIQDYSKIQN